MKDKDPNRKRNLVDKKFLEDYLDAYERGFTLQVKSNGLWLDIETRGYIYISYVADVFNENSKEWCLMSPIGKFFRNNIRIKFDEVDILNEI